MQPGHAEPGSDAAAASAATEELIRAQRDVNEQLLLSTLRAHAETEAAEGAAEELRASEEQLQTLADTMPILGWYANPDGHVPWYNRRWFEYTGTVLEDQVGWKWQSVHDPDDLPRVVAKWKAALETGEPWEDEFRLRRHDGQLRWFLARAAPLRNARGPIIRWFGTCVDIDDQKRAEAALRHQNTLAMLAADVGRAFTLNGTLREILEDCCSSIVRHLEVAFARVWIVDGDGTTLELQASAGMYKHTDGPHARVRVGDRKIGWIAATRECHVTNDVPGDPHIDDPLWARRTGMASFAGYPLVIAGRLVGVLATFSQRPLRADVVGGLASVANTIAMGVARTREEAERSRLLASEQEARKGAEAANRVKDEFLATMSHELRTPLSAILGWSAILRRGFGDAKSVDRALATIERNAKTQARLIEDMLDVSRIISGKLRLDMRRLDMNAIARAALDVVRPAADAKGVRLISQLARMESLVGDADRLQQAMWNLLSNAVKFTPAGGTVSLRIERSSSTVRFVVRDTGSGIPREHLPFIFDRFRQVNSSTTRRHSGLGLGLAIVRHLVELHGGEVLAESDGPGLGSVFTVSLPIRAAEEAGAEEDDAELETTEHASPSRRTSSRPPVVLAGVKVLVVDDDEDSRRLIQGVLEHVGASVTTADSARAGFAFIEAHAVDVLISDIGMPDEDGFSFMQRLRALPANRGGQVPALALTAYARSEDAARAREVGYQAYLAKPADIDELARRVASLVR